MPRVTLEVIRAASDRRPCDVRHFALGRSLETASEKLEHFGSDAGELVEAGAGIGGQ